MRVEGDDGVPNDDISMRRWGLEEELVGEGDGEAGAVDAEESGGDKGVTEDGGLGGVGVEEGGKEGEVEDGARLEGEGEEVRVEWTGQKTEMAFE